jgi:hypothetical protein
MDECLFDLLGPLSGDGEVKLSICELLWLVSYTPPQGLL